ncbi:MAG: ferrous iron transport protein B [Actinobacteria bacterium]|nr:ferrous iron transport protein B [Actinomycetota bacterium]
MIPEKKELNIVIAGNPNSGKTTIFNELTGLRQHVGNYPGVTVEKKSGGITYKGYKINITDLPGTYSLTAFSQEEIVARNYIIDRKPDVVVDIVDSSSLERNLYLTTQLIELDLPIVMALNMTDIARKEGKKINTGLLSKLLGMPVVETVGSKGKGIDELLEAILEVGLKGELKHVDVKYGEEAEEEITKLVAILNENYTLPEKYYQRWIAVKLLEQDEEVIKNLKKLLKSGYTDIDSMVQDSINHMNDILRDSPEVIIAAGRYGFIRGALRESYEETDIKNVDVTEKIDVILTNRIIGIPIFAVIIWLMFQFVFSLGKYPMGWIEFGFEKLSTFLTSVIPEGFIQSLIVDGIIGGVGGVIIFTPNIMLLFFMIALLEDSGYMARAAFVMDRIMHKIGLHGKSFIPMIIGFGCTVPAYMGSRILENRKDRLVTMHINTFCSCGARLPVYILIAGAFFPAIAGNVIFSLYFIGIIFAVIMARVLRATRFRGESEPFVMELPPYRIPTLKGIFIHTWERTWMYIKKAGTVILAISVLMWALFTFPMIGNEYSQDYQAQIAGAEIALESGQISQPGYEETISAIESRMAMERLEYSAAGRIGKFLEPVFRPLGFDWKMVIAILAGVAAKEVIVSTMGTLFSIQEADEQSGNLQEVLADSYHPLVGYNFMLFVLLYFPCMASMAVFRKEAGTKEMLFQMGYTLALAWTVALIVYQVGRLFI